MCGIVGAMGECSSELIEKMAKKLAHRGPDNLSTQSINDNIYLGHARLSIIDLSSSSNQPLWDITGRFCIVFNGEIYNYKSLREELIALGYAFLSKGDAEVILNLYQQFGPSCLDKLNGIFAFAIWDNLEEQLFIARDKFGVKPLYYTQNSHGFYFASELKSLLIIPGIDKTLNYEAIYRTIIFLWSPGPETILQQVLKLEPGYFLVIKNKKIIKKEMYYTWPQYNPTVIKTNEAIAITQKALQQSVKEQLVADVPIGSFLSGGLDSSLLVALAKEAGAKNLQCYTIDSIANTNIQEGFSEDLPYAMQVAKYLNVDLDIVKAAPDIIQLLPKMLYHLDEPQADPAPLNVLLICEAARRKGIKVLFSGAGGDDIFTGYRRHLAITWEKYWSWMPSFLRKKIKDLTHKLPKHNSLLRRLSKMFAYADLNEDERLLSYFYWIDPKIVNNLFVETIQEKIKINPMRHILEELKLRSSQSKLEKMLYLERRYFLVDHNFNYTDKMSMAEGIEVRVPFLDSKVVDVAAKIKNTLKQRGSKSKWVLKKVAEHYLPKSVIYRSKTGFGAPLRYWLKNDLKPLIQTFLNNEQIQKRGIFKPEEIQKLIDEDRAGKADYSYPIFALLCLELWFQIFLDEEYELNTLKLDKQSTFLREISEIV